MKRKIKRIANKVGKKILRLFQKIDKRYLHYGISRCMSDFGGVARMPDVEHSFLLSGKPNYVRNYVGRKVPFSRIVTVPVVDVIRMQYDKYISSRYNRYDIPIRFLAIEQMEGKNNFGQEWDNQLQVYWSGTDWQERFEKLYKSIKENGLDESTCIDTDWDMRICDGSHRLSIALYNKEEFINVRINSFYIPDVYTNHHGAQFLYRAGFTKEQIEVVNQKMEEVLDLCQYPFIGILWPASRHFWDEILQDIREYNPGNVKVKDWMDVEMTEDGVSGFIKAVYYLDDVTDENLEKKRLYNIISSQITDNKYPIRIVRLDIRNPYYRVKSVSGLPQSREIILLKEAIRGHYAPRVYEYKRDVIFHVADNYLQSKFIWQLMQVNRDISDFYRLLQKRNIEYAIIKRSKHYSPSPMSDAHKNQFVIKTDIDLLVDDKDVSKMLNLVKEFSAHHFANIDWIEEEEVKANYNPEYNKFYRITMQGFSIFLFHIQSRYYELRLDYLHKLLDNRRIDGMQTVIDQPIYEVYIRLADLMHYPHKKHHIEYVKHYYQLFTEEGIKEAFEPHVIEKVKNKLKEIIQ